MTPSALVVVTTSPDVRDGVEPGAEVVAAAEGLLPPPELVVGALPSPMGTLGDILVEVVVSAGPLGEPPTVVVGALGLPGFTTVLPSEGPTGLGVATPGAVGDCPASVGLGTRDVVGEFPAGGLTGAVPLLGIA